MTGSLATSQVYSEYYWRPISCALFLLGVGALSAMVSHRMPALRWKEIKEMGAPRIALLLVLCDSLLFVFTAAFLQFGIGTSYNEETCDTGMWLCVLFYATTKGFITVFLIERAHIVLGNHQPRLKSKLYLGNWTIMLGWFAFLIVLILDRRTGIRPDGECFYHAGASRFIAMGVFDISSDIYFTILFAVPLYKSVFKSNDIRWVAMKSIVAALVSMTSSATNLFVLAVMHGTLLSWVCFSACTTDVIINATVLFLITRHKAVNVSYIGSGVVASSNLATPNLNIKQFFSPKQGYELPKIEVEEA